MGLLQGPNKIKLHHIAMKIKWTTNHKNIPNYKNKKLKLFYYGIESIILGISWVYGLKWHPP